MPKERSTENNGKKRRTSGFVRPTTGRFEALDDVPTNNSLPPDFGEMDVIAPVPGMPPPPTPDMLPDYGGNAPTVVRPAQERLFIATPSVTKGAEYGESTPYEESVGKTLRKRKTERAEKKSWWDKQALVVRFILIILPAIMVGYTIAMILILVLSARSATDAPPFRNTLTPFPTNTLPAIVIKPTLPNQNITLTPVVIPTVTPLPTPTLLPTALPTGAPANPTVIPTITPTTRPATVAPTAIITTTVAPTTVVTVTVAPTTTVATTTVAATATVTTTVATTPAPNPTRTNTVTAPTATPTINALTIAPTTAPLPPTVPAQNLPTPTSNVVTVAPTPQTSPRG